jgi:FMN phosphatase YigB (HAD superfamily)
MNSFRALIFDVYQTLLNVNRRGGDGEQEWRKLHEEFFGVPPEMTLDHLTERCGHLVSDDHAHAHGFGIPHPEVVWEEIMRGALPQFADLPPARGEEFLYRHIQLLRDLHLAPECARVLAFCRERGIPLGIVSNAQPYTLRELGEGLAGVGLSPDVFEKDLCIWSFENGFSKPDPHVFRMLAFRLRRRGIRPEETLIVGDRLDNDIEPARAQGFQTWWLNESEEGGWEALWRTRFAPAAAGSSAEA